MESKLASAINSMSGNIFDTIRNAVQNIPMLEKDIYKFQEDEFTNSLKYYEGDTLDTVRIYYMHDLYRSVLVYTEDDNSAAHLGGWDLVRYYLPDGKCLIGDNISDKSFLYFLKEDKGSCKSGFYVVNVDQSFTFEYKIEFSQHYKDSEEGISTVYYATVDPELYTRILRTRNSVETVDLLDEVMPNLVFDEKELRKA